MNTHTCQFNVRFFLSFILMISTGIIVKAQVPLLNSAPQYTPTIYLDFDGQYVNTPRWNSGVPINCAPSGLVATQIIEVFNRISEDYRPFALNVTTDSAVFLAAPLTGRIRVIVTTTSAWYPSAVVAGVSYTGAFTFGDNTPAFVFSDRAIQNYSKAVAEATSHEVGHALGLSHQSIYNNSCVLTDQYNPGQGMGEIAWAPIMGSSFNNNVTLWHNGKINTGCANTQDALAVITTQNGFTYRTDDFGNTIATAFNYLLQNNQIINQSGIIEKNTDKDVFKFVFATKGHLQLYAKPYSIGASNDGANLDIKLIVYNSAGTIIKTSNPTTILNASVDTILVAGTYYAEIDGVANAYANEYGMLGSYTLSGSFLPLSCDSIVTTSTILPDNGTQNGSIDITVGGSTGPFSYLWSNGATSQDITNLVAGIYTVQVTHTQAGCYKQYTYNVANTDPNACASITINGVAMPDGGTGTGRLDITVSGTNDPISYKWSNGSTYEDLINAWSGNYTVTVTNTLLNCTRQASFTIPLNSSCTSLIETINTSNFETGLGAWNQVTTDNFDWIRLSGHTPTANTGPAAAYEGNYYLYAEASSPNNNNKVAIIESNCISLRNAINPTLDFKYCLTGSDIGTLEWQIQRLGATNYHQLGIFTGAQGAGWLSNSTNIGAYAGGIVRLRFVATTKKTPKDKGDIAIDLVTINPNIPAQAGLAPLLPTVIDEKYWEQGIVLYPNPTNGQFNLAMERESKVETLQINVFNVMGQLVNSDLYQNVNENSMEKTIDISHVNDGIYTVAVTINNQQTYTYRIVKTQ